VQVKTPARSNDVEVERRRALEKIRASLVRRGSPHAQMSLIVAATGCAGFLSSFALLHLGLRMMWLRYALAIGLAYGAFLGLIGAWLALQRRKLAGRPPRSQSGSRALDVVNISPGGIGRGAASGAARVAGRGGEYGGGGASAAFSEAGVSGPSVVPVPMPVAGNSVTPADVAGAGGHAGSGLGGGFNLDLDDAVVVVAAIAAVLAAIAASVYVVFTAPALFGEVMFDGALSAGLYRRLRALNHHQWWEDAIRHTAIPVTAVLVFFGAAGYMMQRYAPEAASIGAVVHRLLHQGI
jgi:hypothetical protein